MLPISASCCRSLSRIADLYLVKPTCISFDAFCRVLPSSVSVCVVLQIGRQAFVDGFLEESSEWLQLSVAKLEEQAAGRGRHHYTQTKRGQACGLLGRAYYFVSPRHVQTAQELCESRGGCPGLPSLISLRLSLIHISEPTRR